MLIVVFTYALNLLIYVLNILLLPMFDNVPITYWSINFKIEYKHVIQYMRIVQYMSRFDNFVCKQYPHVFSTLQKSSLIWFFSLTFIINRRCSALIPISYAPWIFFFFLLKCEVKEKNEVKPHKRYNIPLNFKTLNFF